MHLKKNHINNIPNFFFNRNNYQIELPIFSITTYKRLDIITLKWKWE